MRRDYTCICPCPCLRHCHGVHLTQDRAQERTLAHADAADDADEGARGDVQRDVGEDGRGGEGRGGSSSVRRYSEIRRAETTMRIIASTTGGRRLMENRMTLS
jgi:hypothetical protein